MMRRFLDAGLFKNRKIYGVIMNNIIIEKITRRKTGPVTKRLKVKYKKRLYYCGQFLTDCIYIKEINCDGLVVLKHIEGQELRIEVKKCV